MAERVIKSSIDSSVSRKDRAENKVRKQRSKRRKEEKKNGGLKNVLPFLRDKDADDDSSVKQNKFLVETLPTYHTPSFTTHNGRWMSMVQLYARRGTNRDMTFDEILDIIPVDSRDGVEMNFMVNETSIKGDEKKRIIRQNAKSGKGNIRSAAIHGSEEDIENRSNQIGEMADLEDFDEYEEILDSAHPVIVFNVALQVIGPDQHIVEDQIEDLNTALNQRHEGLQWDSLGGDQVKRVRAMFTRVPKDRFQMTSTSSNYSGINFSVNAGLNDPSGLPVGGDAMSLTGTTSYFDMDGSLRRQAIVAIPRGSQAPDYIMEGEENSPSLASIFTQYAANHAVFNGHRVHHIVLNDFNYMEPRRYYRPYTKEGMERYDVANVTINPLQGFGDRSEAVAIFSRVTKKIVNIFDILTNLEMTEHQRAIVLQAVSNFFFNKELYSEQNPFISQMVNVTNPKTYPTMGEMLNEFTTDARRALNNNQELRSQDIETLESILKQELQANRGILGEPTKIKPPQAQQVYYDFSKIEASDIRQVQFINLIDYIIYTAEKGDVIAIHGTEQLWTDVLEMPVETITSAMNKGIRFIYSFDTVSGDNRMGKMQSDMFSMQNKFYKDLDTDVDWSVVGKCLPNEVDAYETALASELSHTIRASMQAKSNQVLVHRNVGDVNNFVHVQVIV